MDGWSDSEWVTLQLGPVWVASAIVGRNWFDQPEEEAFWEAVEGASTTSALSHQLMHAARRHRDWLLDEFQLDERSIVTGLTEVVSLLERVPVEVSRETRQVMLDVGSHLARARGPFGRRASQEDLQTLVLVAQLLESVAETARDNPLNAASAT